MKVKRKDVKSISILMNGNCQEWFHAMQARDRDGKPRLPVPRALLEIFLGEKHHFLGASYASKITSNINPFIDIVSTRNFLEIRKRSDQIVSWGNFAIFNCMLDIFLAENRRKTIYISYSWPSSFSTVNKLRLFYSYCQVFWARFAREVYVMTEEQKVAAQNFLGAEAKVKKMNFLLDFDFYSSHVPCKNELIWFDQFRRGISNQPYLIMLGDELRMDDHAFELARATGYSLVRVCQYMSEEQKQKVLKAAAAKGVTTKYFLMQQVSYDRLLLLLRNASVYLGLVDSTWQPAGWTALCEALCCNTPAVVYEGLVSRELQFRDIPNCAIKVVKHGDIAAACQAVHELVLTSDNIVNSRELIDFARTNLAMSSDALDVVC